MPRRSPSPRDSTRRRGRRLEIGRGDRPAHRSRRGRHVELEPDDEADWTPALWGAAGVVVVLGALARLKAYLLPWLWLPLVEIQHCPPGYASQAVGDALVCQPLAAASGGLPSLAAGLLCLGCGAALLLHLGAPPRHPTAQHLRCLRPAAVTRRRDLHADRSPRGHEHEVIGLVNVGDHVFAREITPSATTHRLRAYINTPGSAAEGAWGWVSMVSADGERLFETLDSHDVSVHGGAGGAAPSRIDPRLETVRLAVRALPGDSSPRRHAPLTLGATPASFGPAPEHWLDLMDFDGGAEPLELAATEPAGAESPLRNSYEVEGRVAVVHRGLAEFATAVRHCQHAGALGVLIVNNEEKPHTARAARADSDDITIPSLMIRRSDGELLWARLEERQQVLIHEIFLDPAAHLSLSRSRSDRSTSFGSAERSLRGGDETAVGFRMRPRGGQAWSRSPSTARTASILSPRSRHGSRSPRSPRADRPVLSPRSRSQGSRSPQSPVTARRRISHGRLSPRIVEDDDEEIVRSRWSPGQGSPVRSPLRARGRWGTAESDSEDDREEQQEEHEEEEGTWLLPSPTRDSVRLVRTRSRSRSRSPGRSLSRSRSRSRSRGRDDTQMIRSRFAV